MRYREVCNVDENTKTRDWICEPGVIHGYYITFYGDYCETDHN